MAKRRISVAQAGIALNYLDWTVDRTKKFSEFGEPHELSNEEYELKEVCLTLIRDFITTEAPAAEKEMELEQRIVQLETNLSYLAQHHLEHHPECREAFEEEDDE